MNDISTQLRKLADELDKQPLDRTGVGPPAKPMPIHDEAEHKALLGLLERALKVQPVEGHHVAKDLDLWMGGSWITRNWECPRNALALHAWWCGWLRIVGARIVYHHSLVCIEDRSQRQSYDTLSEALAAYLNAAEGGGW